MPRRKSGDEELVRQRIESVRRAHKVRWTISRHTAEVAIAAFTGTPPVKPPQNPKSRRRKRHKRLL